MFKKRPWGICEILVEAIDYRCKRIAIDPGHELSMQSHPHRHLTWTIVSGEGRAELGVDAITIGADGISSKFRDTPIYKWNVYPGTTLLVPPQCIHRIKCLDKSNEPLIYIEVQRGISLRDADATRLDDAYGRSSF